MRLVVFASLLIVKTSVSFRVSVYVLLNNFCVSTSRVVHHTLLQDYVTKSAAVWRLTSVRPGLSVMTSPVPSQVTVEG